MPRHAALAILSRWDPQRNHLEDLWSGPLGKLDARDGALARHLVEQAVRNIRLIDYWIERMASRPISPTGRGQHRSLDPETLNLLRLGLVQVRFTRIPAHAAVDSITGMAPQRSRGFVNALLRRACRETDSLGRWAEDAPPAIRHGISDALWAHWVGQRGATQAESLANSLRFPAPVSFRINTFHPNHRVAADCPDLRPIPGHDGYYRMEGPLPASWLADGLIAVQDPGASLATELLSPQSGETLLDACASPGGKARRMAEMAGGKRRIVAMDRAGRIGLLEENLQRWQVPGIECISRDWRDPTSASERVYDAALVDAPCSNTGVLRRRPEARYRFSLDTLGQVAGLQRQILDTVASLVKPGGRLVYSTCSLEAEENENQAWAFLDRHPGWTMGRVCRSDFPDGAADGHFAVVLRRH